MGVITIRVSDDIDKELTELTKKTKISKNRLVSDALQRYLKIKKFRELRKETKKYAEKQGFYRDEDVFNTVS
jgi:predicted transcriptional regulator